jgi:DNA-binding MarR family transcriptional regulator
MPRTAAGPRARRSPTPEELGTWRNFIETTERLRSLTGSRLQTESALSSADYAVLLTLSEAEGTRVRSSELAARVGWERSRLSHHLGRMEQRGLIRREECATDSRGAEAVLTPVGAEAFRHALPAHMHAIQELFVAALSPEQLEAVRDITRALASHLSQ